MDNSRSTSTSASTIMNTSNDNCHDHGLPTTEPAQSDSSLPLRDLTSNPNYHTSTLTRYLTTPLTPSSHFTSTLLLLLAFATGINDAATFIDYHLFVSNQTGNTIFLGVGALSHSSINFDLGHVGLSLGCFCAGGIVAGQIGAYVTSKRARWWVVSSNLFQTLLTFAAAGLRQWYATVDTQGPNRGSPRAYSVVSTLAFASGLQVAMARGLGVAEIPTGMITSAWIDLVSDEQVWAVWKRNPARDRRAAFVLCILVGGILGAAAHAYCAPALPLLLTGIIKAVVTIGFLMGKGEEIESVKGHEQEKMNKDEKV